MSKQYKQIEIGLLEEDESRRIILGQQTHLVRDVLGSVYIPLKEGETGFTRLRRVPYLITRLGWTHVDAVGGRDAMWDALGRPSEWEQERQPAVYQFLHGIKPQYLYRLIYAQHLREDNIRWIETQKMTQGDG